MTAGETAGGGGQPEAPPFVRSIVWTPRKLATGVAPAVGADLVFSQPALKQARDHASSSPNAPVGGILLGRVHEDPTGGRRWVLVEAAVRAKRPLPEDASAEILWATLQEVIDPGRPGEVVGWYRTHARTGVYLSEQEASLQDARFVEPWQCAMILAGSAEHPVGGVFQRTQAGTLSRSGYTAFFELIDPSSEFQPGWKRTFVGWSNYQTDVSIALAGKGGVSAVIPSVTQPAHETLGGDSDRPDPAERETRPAPVPVDPRPLEPVRPREVVPGRPPVVLEGPARVADGPARVASRPAPVASRPARVSGEPARVARTDPAPPAGVRVTPAPGGAPVTSEQPPPSAGSEAVGEANETDESWSEVQIRRSLSAVGRTLGPSVGGSPGSTPPVPEVGPVALEDEESATPPPEPVRLRDRGGREVPAARSDTVLLEPRDPWPAGEDIEAFVGGARRRSRVPVRALALAATGLVALLGGGWFVMDRVGGARGASGSEGAQTPPDIQELAAESDRDASMAGVTLGQGPLFSHGSGAAEAPEAEYLWVGPQLSWVRADSEGSDPVAADATGEGPAAAGETPGTTGSSDPSLELVPATTPSATTPTDEDRSSAGAPQGDPAENRVGAEADRAGSVPPLESVDRATPLPLEGLELDDPAVAAFEDALGIFRKEVARYDSLRVAFDDQLAGCNALNLSYRGVRESYRRLASRFEAAREQFAGPGLQAYRSAGRQVAVIDVHYELSECPPPRGG